jgi:hypothetical protein
MKTMKCLQCVTKHLAAALSYGKEIMGNHGQGEDLDHRIDMQGELANAEHHLAVLNEQKLRRTISTLRHKMEASNFAIDEHDLELIRKAWLLLQGNNAASPDSSAKTGCKSCGKKSTTTVSISDGAPPLLDGNTIAITCTGDRPEQFVICLELMKKQTVKPDKWIIVDDGATPLTTEKLPDYAEYIRRSPQANDPKHTLALNLKQAVKQLSSKDKVIFIEDDDYYPADWIERCVDALLEVDLAGCDSRYYQLSENRYKRIVEKKSVLANTAITGFAITYLGSSLNNLNWDVDMRLWRGYGGRKNNKILEADDKRHPVGLKMWMTGRPGMTRSWTKRDDFYEDPDRAKLMEWLGDDFTLYKNY